MKQPAIHAKLHPSRCDTWDPYRQRDGRTPILDDNVFDLLNTHKNRVSPSLFMTGCLDAPEEIPLGATSSIQCVGGWRREEYLRLGREFDDWARYQRAMGEVGTMLRNILGECELEELT